MATVLKILLAERHLKSHPDFLAAYDSYAAQLDPPIPPGYGPAKAQYYQWLSGRMVGLPRNYHCRVLEQMFPGWTIEELFQTADSATPGTRWQRARLPDPEVRLETFLGTEMATSGITMVYPAFGLTDAATDARQAAESTHRHTFGKPHSLFADRHHIDVPSVVAEDDLRGLLYVLSLLQRHTSIPIDIQSDRNVVAHRDRPYISFGLTDNDCTHMYLDTVELPLFTIRYSTAENRSCAMQLQLTDGSRYTASDDRNVGIIARVRPNPELHPDRYWIYCAGLGSRGTAGAGWYLANYWHPLQQRTGDREFVAVLGIGTHSDRTAGLEHLLIASAERI
ncbi:hypothetical protein ACL02S_12690 [Nocardia sp. 004]|uniref:hypothetical protein n=1 Tax=Nocardia sp. 004 TaxID=3385978 RepID=UPI0039A1C7CF